MTPPLSLAQIRQRLSTHNLSDQLDGYIFPRLQGFSPKEASVLILISPIANNDWEIILTRRTDQVQSHKGQVSFPGGARDAVDADDIDTALREVYEEIGVNVPRENVLGKINTRKTISNFMVSTFVASAPEDLRFEPNPSEVDRVFAVPLSWLRDPANYQSSIHPESNQEIYRFMEFDHEVIWGVTAGIIVDLVRVLDDENRSVSRFDQ